MKIAILTEILSTHSGSRAPIELAKNLTVGNKVTLLAYSYNVETEVKKELEEQGVKVVLINPLKAPFGKWLAIFKFLPYLKKADFISFHGTIPTFFAAKFSGKPIVKTYYGTQLNAYLERLSPDEKPKLKDKLLNWLVNKLILLIEKLCFHLSNQVVAISKYTSLEAQRLYGKKVPFIYLGVSPFPKLKPKTHAPNSSLTLLSVSRITPYKGFHLLIEAVKQVNPNISLIIAGSSPQPKYLDFLNKIKTNKTRIIIDISDEKLAELYQNCDLYVSLDRYLFFGFPPLEAALFAKPSVLLDSCAACEIVKDKQTGFLAKDIEEFIKYLKLLIDNSNLRIKMGQEAKNFAEKDFSWSQTAEHYKQLFTKLPRS